MAAEASFVTSDFLGVTRFTVGMSGKKEESGRKMVRTEIKIPKEGEKLEGNKGGKVRKEEKTKAY